MVKSKDTGEDDPKGKGEGKSKASNWVHSKDLKKLQHNRLVGCLLQYGKINELDDQVLKELDVNKIDRLREKINGAQSCLLLDCN